MLGQTVDQHTPHEGSQKVLRHIVMLLCCLTKVMHAVELILHVRNSKHDDHNPNFIVFENNSAVICSWCI